MPQICDLTFSITPKFAINNNTKALPWAAFFSAQFRVKASDTDHVSETIPTLYILMKNRNRSTYKAAFEYVVARLAGPAFGYNLQKQNDAEDRVASFDYEKAEREEYSKAFKIDVTGGCFMHVSSNFYINLCAYGMKDALDYKKKTNRPFFQAYRTIKCIGLLPLHKMREGWEICKANLLATVPHGFKTKLKNWIKNYFELWYMNESATAKYFALSDWNFYLSNDRTQGSIEGQHRIWHLKAGSHPLIWQFIEFLQEEDALAQLRYNQIQANNGKTRVKRCDEREKEDQLGRLWYLLEHDQISVAAFLECSSVAINMNWDVLHSLYSDYDLTYAIHSCGGYETTTDEMIELNEVEE